MGGYDRTLLFVGLSTFSHDFAYNVLQGGLFTAVVVASLVLVSPDIRPNTQDNPDLHRALLRLNGILFLCLVLNLASTLFMALGQQWGHLMLLDADTDTLYCPHKWKEGTEKLHVP
jgi:hypothetical protein